MMKVACTLLWILGVSSYSMTDNTTDYHQRADTAIQSYLLNFWNQGSCYINADCPFQNDITQYWNFAQGFDAVLDAIERTNAEQYYGWANTFYNSQAEVGWGRNWYDDENWMALALLRAYNLAMAQGDTSSANNFINVTTMLLNDISNAWDTTCCGNVKGGIWWDKSHTQKATASNAGPVILASQLYQLTGNEQYLDWAEEWFAFWSTNMVSSSYEVADHIGADGSIVWWKFTYNSGLMVGAATELYKATKNQNFLSLAHNYASFMLTNMTVSSIYGPVLTDGSSANCGGDCQEFKGPAYRYLINLYQTDPENSKDIYALLQASAIAIWEIGRDPTRDLFSTDWVESLSSSATVSDSQQNVASQALSLWAENYGPYPGSGFVPGQYEAENGEFYKIGVEATYAGFLGWGYAAGWGEEGESVSIYFLLNTTFYAITYRYATEMDAARAVLLDGSILSTKESFYSTGGYVTYQGISSGRLFGSPGYHTLTIIYLSSYGSFGFVNLDSVLISPE